MMTQESLHTDVIIVGAGPAGLSCAIRLKQLNPEYHICILEKGAGVGAHILSGAILDPKALNELLPDWPSYSPPKMTPVKKDYFLYLTKNKSLSLPVPRILNNQHNSIIRLSVFCQWLSTIAENMGIEIFTGFAGSDLIFDEKKEKLIGIQTDTKGLDKNNNTTSRTQPGIAIYAQHILLAEGVRGSLSQKIIRHFNLDRDCDPQTYGLGVKELWEIAHTQHRSGEVFHTIGYPLDHQTYGGGFLYYIDDTQVALGFVVGLDYQNPHRDPFKELQKFKTHPRINKILHNARRIGYGAKSLVEGGLQSLPQLHFPGGLLIGDCAGFLNAAKLKGTHTAMKSGMIAAESIFKGKLEDYQNHIKNSWLFEDELYPARNIRPSFRFGLIPGLMLAAIDNLIFRGKAPWTLHHKKPDYLYTEKNAPSISYPKPDNKITFDKSSSLILSNIHHDDNQPIHLKLKDTTFKQKSYEYCPAQVYEIHEEKLYIHSQNCLHCKACDIKDSDQNIVWTPPEGGSGPDFSGM